MNTRQAMAILLVMVVMMIRQVQVEPIYPESNRDRLLYDYGVSMQGEQSSGSSHLGMELIDRIYGDLEGAEAISIVASGCEPYDVNADGGIPEMVDVREADENVWRIYDYVFINGSPYTKGDVDAGNKVAVLTESLARKLFGSVDVSGRTVLLKQYPYRIAGVVKDISPLMGWSYAQCWIPIDKNPEQWMRMDAAIDKYFGPYSVITMANRAEDVDAIRREIRSRNATLNSELKTSGWERVDTDYPYTQEYLYFLKGTNRAPDISSTNMIRWILLAIIILVPAINLSSMTQSRLRQRRHEIGVRRAFGATKSGIMLSMLRENLVVTLAGGLLGLILAFVFSWLFTSLFYDPIYSW
ncbi:MAG: ABC transporter permease, partial [Duncaniella sp.]|nr:ABC transporter permease [Duncaniella sp.]